MKNTIQHNVYMSFVEPFICLLSGFFPVAGRLQHGSQREKEHMTDIAQ
jgi:hypothetical protein